MKQIGRYLIRYAHNRIYDLGLSIHEAVYSETLMNWPCPKVETLLRRTYTFDSVCFRYAFLSRISKAKTVKRTLFQTDNFSFLRQKGHLPYADTNKNFMNFRETEN